MADEIKLDDNPSIETQLYVIARTINSLTHEIRDQNEKIDSNTNSLDEMRLLQREQNSNVANLTDKHFKLTKRMDAHDDWHGEEDEKLAKRIYEEELAEAERRGEHKGIWKVLGLEINAIKWLIGGGLVTAGLTLGKLINLIGWW